MEEPSWPHYLPITGERIIGFITLPGILGLCKKIQSASSKIWTWVAKSTSYKDNSASILLKNNKYTQKETKGKERTWEQDI